MRDDLHDLGQYYDNICDGNSFNKTNIVSCAQEGFVYKTDEIMIVNEVYLPLLQYLHEPNP